MSEQHENRVEVGLPGLATAFAGEPGEPPASTDLARGRTRRRRRVTVRAILVGLAAVLVAGSAWSATRWYSPQLTEPVSPVRSATPEPSTTSVPTPSPTQTADRTTGSDTAPKLSRDSHGAYVDRDGLGLDERAWSSTRENLYALLRTYLDPDMRHLGPHLPYELLGSGGPDRAPSLQVGQEWLWTTAGENGEGDVRLAVTRLGAGTAPRLGPDHGLGFCGNDIGASHRCRRTVLAGTVVWLQERADGGFVMDVRQADGEIASIKVSAYHNPDATIPLPITITPTDAVALLTDPAFDLVP